MLLALCLSCAAMAASADPQATRTPAAPPAARAVAPVQELGGGGERWVGRRKAWHAYRAEPGERAATFAAALSWLAAQPAPEALWVPVRETDVARDAADAPGDVAAAGEGVGVPDAAADAPPRDVRASALAMLVFSGLGDTPVDGDHRSPVKHAMKVLVERIDPATGEFLDARSRPVSLEDHALATLALGEIWHSMKSPFLRKHADLAVARLVEGTLANGAFRTPHGRQAGGEQEEGGAALLEIDRLAWCVHALAELHELGFAVDPLAFERALHEVETSTDAAAGRLDRQRGSPLVTSDEVLLRDTAIGLYVRLRALAALGRETRPTLAELAVLPVAEVIPEGRLGGGIDLVFCLFGALADRSAGGPTAERWNQARNVLPVNDQVREGPLAGSFAPLSADDPPAGRIEATALTLLWIETGFAPR